MVLSTRVTEIVQVNRCSDGYSTGMWKEVVDKQSITNIFEEVYKNFKV